MNSTSGGSRFRAPISAMSGGSAAPRSMIIRSGMPHSFPDGDVSGVFRPRCSPCTWGISRVASSYSPLLEDGLLQLHLHAHALVELRRSGGILAVDAERDAADAAAVELAERVQEECAPEPAAAPGPPDADRSDLAPLAPVRIVAHHRSDLRTVLDQKPE